MERWTTYGLAGGAGVVGGVGGGGVVERVVQKIKVLVVPSLFI